MIFSEFKLINSIKYVIFEDNDRTGTYLVKAIEYTNADIHEIVVNDKDFTIKCDCTTYSNFHIFCRHMLVYFLEESAIDISYFVNCLNIRWRKQLLEPYTLDNPLTQAKINKNDTKVSETLKMYGMVRSVRDIIFNCNNDDREAIMKAFTDSIKLIKTQFKNPFNEKSNSAKSNKTDEQKDEQKDEQTDEQTDESITYHIIANSKPTGRPKLTKATRKLNPTPKSKKRKANNQGSRKKKKPDRRASATFLNETDCASASESEITDSSDSISSTASDDNNSSTESDETLNQSLDESLLLLEDFENNAMPPPGPIRSGPLMPGLDKKSIN